jgi:hypothetical protein
VQNESNLTACRLRVGCCAVSTSYLVDKAYKRFKLGNDASGGLWEPATPRFQYLGRS